MVRNTGGFIPRLAASDRGSDDPPRPRRDPGCAQQINAATILDGRGRWNSIGDFTLQDARPTGSAAAVPTAESASSPGSRRARGETLTPDFSAPPWRMPRMPPVRSLRDGPRWRDGQSPVGTTRKRRGAERLACRRASGTSMPRRPSDLLHEGRRATKVEVESPNHRTCRRLASRRPRAS